MGTSHPDPRGAVNLVEGIVQLWPTVRPSAENAVGASARAVESAGNRAAGSTVWRSHIRPGRDIYGRDEEWVGVVKEVRAEDFLVARPLQRDVYVPIRAVGLITDDSIVLTVCEDAVDDTGWMKPPLFGSRPE